MQCDPNQSRIATFSRPINHSKVRTKLCADMKTVKIYPEIFPKFKDEIVKYYHKTMAQAGEAVGIITAQSIGERQTQTTLNSLDWNEKIIVNVNGSCVIEPIGQFIDTVLDDPKNTKSRPHPRKSHGIF